MIKIFTRMYYLKYLFTLNITSININEIFKIKSKFIYNFTYSNWCLQDYHKINNLKRIALLTFILNYLYK